MSEHMAEQSEALAAERPDDAALLAAARGGSETAYAAIIRRHNRRLFRIARSILHNDAEAEDAVQDAYVQVFRNLHTLREDSSLSTWLGRITANEALGRLRRRRPTVGLEVLDEAMEQGAGMIGSMSGNGGDPTADDPERAAARQEVRGILEEAIDRLPLEFRSVFVACAVEQMSIEETAACLGLPQNTVKTRYFRAKRRLRGMLGADFVAAMPESFAFGGEHCDRMTERVLARIADLKR
jgi:RNA polymerase sigma-70 factor (ECF subfamily)